MPLADLLSQMKDDPVTPLSGATSGLHLSSVIQMIAALAIVVLILKWVVPKVLSKWQPTAGEKDSGGIRIVASATVGAGSVHVLEVEGRRFLVGASANGFAMLSELDADSRLASLSTNAAEASNETFRQILERLEKLCP